MPQNVWLVLKICRSKTGDGEGYLIMPPWMVPLWGSWVTLYRSSINSCLWDWAETRPAYLVTSGQSWEATTCRANQCFFFSKYVDWCRQEQPLNIEYEIVGLTAEMEGLLSSPGWGWVTSAPNMIVGLSVSKGMHLDTASARTVFLPPTFENKRPYVLESGLKKCTKHNKKSNTNLDVYLQSKVCQDLFVHFKHLLC
jgi:hypothetical protein